jgi:hypothetical protein
MKKILLFSVALITSLVLVAQICPQPFPNTTPYVVYDADAVHSNSGDVIWICRDLTVEISGDGNNIFIEKGCSIILSGDGNSLYQKGSGDLTVTGMNNPVVKFETSITFADNGTGNSVTSCDTIKYDYTFAPKAPKKFCNVWLGLNEVKDKQSLRLYPNPATSVLNYEIPSDVTATNVEIFSTTGQKVYTSSIGKNEGEIDISQLNNGLYLVILNTDKGQYSGRVNVE